MLATVQVVLALVLGLAAPGYLLARVLVNRDWLLFSFPLSLVVLFSTVFLTQIAGLPITAPVVGSFLSVVVLILLALQRFRPEDSAPASAPNRPARQRAIPLLLAALIALFIWRTTLWPLSGIDNAFRWDFLARCILRLHELNFYPPIKPADYRVYFYPDGIPPLVSFSYWWLYAMAGGVHPALTGILVGAQLPWILWFTFRIGRSLHSSAAGWLAAGILAGSTLFMRSVAVGQETGLTALSLAAMLYAILEFNGWRGMALAGLTGSVASLSREYGCIIPVLGIIAAIWRGAGFRNAMILCGISLLAAGPWYLRNWIVAGNPFFSNRFGPFFVNPVHTAILDHYRGMIGIEQWSAATWRDAGWTLLRSGPFQWTLGTIAALRLVRRRGYLAVAGAVFVLLWLYTVGVTAGGWLYSMRVLTPVLVVLSITAGFAMAEWFPARMRTLMVGAALAWGLCDVALFPYAPKWETIPDWGREFCSVRQPEEHPWQSFPQILPTGARVLCTNSFLLPDLVGRGIDFVPVWSPEVAFLADPSLSGQAVRQLLLRREIRYVAIEPDLDGDFVLKFFRFYQQDMGSWRLIASDGRSEFLYQLPQ